MTSSNPPFSGAYFGKRIGKGLFGGCKAGLTLESLSLPALTLLNRLFGYLAVEVSLAQNHGVRQVHQSRRTSNFYLVALVGWCTRRQTTLWLKAWWCVLDRSNVLQSVLYLVSKHLSSRCRRVARSLTRKGVLNPVARRVKSVYREDDKRKDVRLPR